MRRISINNRDIVLLMLGAVLPDMVAVGYLLQPMGINLGAALIPFHTPIGSVIVAAMISLMFPRRKRAFCLLAIGLLSHFALDSMLFHADGGMLLLFPFNWTSGFQLGLFPSGSFAPLIFVASIAALLSVLKTRKSRWKV